MTLEIDISTPQWHHQQEQQQENNKINNNNIKNINNDVVENDDDDDDDDDDASVSSSPSIPDENINFDLVYALHTFTATVEGQASVFKGDALILMEDTNIYWWLVEVLKTREIGYIPAENIETPYERLARLNKHRNVELTTPSSDLDTSSTLVSGTSKNSKKVTIADDSVLEKINYYEIESEGDYYYEESDIEIEVYQENKQVITNEPENIISTKEITMDNNSMHSNLTNINNINNINSNINNNRMIKSYSTDHIHHTNNTLKRDLSSQSLSNELYGKNLETHDLRVFAGNLGLGPLFHSFSITSITTADELLKEAIKKFNIEQQDKENNNNNNNNNNTIEYYLTVQGTDGDDCILLPQDKPLSIFKTLTASLTTPMPTVSQNIVRKPLPQQQDQDNKSGKPTTTRRKRSSSFGNHEQTNYEEDYVIRFYLHRRIKRAHEQQGLVYIRVSLYPDDSENNDTTTPTSSSSQYSFFFKSKKKKISPAAINKATEIDRIDKILPIAYDSSVGHVINTALEKFHVPDSIADGMEVDQQQEHAHPFDQSQPLAKYSMFVKNGNGE
ncbi:hypothetical protein BJ944DRAFT_228946, partial [Cunninghamella echinulata]